ncbi:GNAT superfamily N-acetyltransferase [Nocardioides cavernae]|uniref:GNAT superfamily N-acetyltransferase n=1 Tax=Nocardioides cavernae TaxID=1921566 RepID=A0A7Y9KTA5_9ACTN|nr:GNAT family N-acetyltransferase [Nocardioides cavernae]NYE36643.1 GNAT superfamily N-acetyltransferase [Nocardioides cavernae]
MTTDPLLEAYDQQLRTDAEMTGALDVVRLGPLHCAVFDHGGFVSYRDLGGVAGRDLDELVERTIAHYRDATGVTSFEWKSRGHDLPADLGEHLAAHGLVAEPVETVMVGEASLLAADVPLEDTPAGPVVVRRLEPGPTAAADLERMLEAQESVFGTGRGPSVESSLRDLESNASEFWVAEVGDRVVCGGRLTPVEGTEFAGIWGGSTLPDFRGRGIYRAVLAARARSAIDRGIRYIHSDCTDMSRPILERSGLRAVTTTTPYVWSR